MLLFVDSEAGDQAEIVAGAYAVAGGAVPLAGGAAGGAARARFAEDVRCRTVSTAVAIGSTTPIGVGIARLRPTRSTVDRDPLGRPKVIQLDGRPAQDVYFERLGVDGADLGESEFNALSMVHPLAEPELSGAVRPRYVRARTADGGLVCATTIERNSAVEICEQTPATIVRSAGAAVEDAVSSLGGSPMRRSSSTARAAARFAALSWSASAGPFPLPSAIPPRPRRGVYAR